VRDPLSQLECHLIGIFHAVPLDSIATRLLLDTSRLPLDCHLISLSDGRYAASLLSQLEAHRHAAAHGERPQAAFLEPWPSFARRAWNVNVSLAALEASGELAELQRLHQVQEVAAARQQADATEEGRQQAARQEEAERQQAPTSLDELD